MIAPGAGKNPSDPTDIGWNPAWNAELPADAPALAEAVACDPVYQTWTPSPGDNEHRPMSCIDWFEAFAFCVWDGGRLPTEGEWDYATIGGSEYRTFPWGEAAPDCTYANFIPDQMRCAATFTNDVGSESPKGDGKWGQADLAGNLWEWVLDWSSNNIALGCANCAHPPPSSPWRVVRGGSFGSDATYLGHQARFEMVPWIRDAVTRARCARNP